MAGCVPVAGVLASEGVTGPAAAGAVGGGLQVAVHQRDGGRAFADRGGDPFDRSAARVTGREHPGQARLSGSGGRLRVSAGDGVAGGVGSGCKDEPLLVAGDALAEPWVAAASR